MRNRITYGDDEIEYVVAPNPELFTKVRIHVHPTGLVEVEAPSGKSAPEICSAVQKRARWISKQLGDASEARAYALPREYVSGETHFYLGHRYQLKVIKGTSEPSSVAMKGGYICIRVGCTDPATVRRRLDSWYQLRAGEYFKRRLSEIAETISWLDTMPPLKLVTMRKQWAKLLAIRINKPKSLANKGSARLY